MVKVMKLNEEQFLEKNIMKVISANKSGLSLVTIIDYLDYLNKIVYDSEKIENILFKLINEQKIVKKDDLFILKNVHKK